MAPRSTRPSEPRTVPDGVSARWPDTLARRGWRRERFSAWLAVDFVERRSRAGAVQRYKHVAIRVLAITPVRSVRDRSHTRKREWLDPEKHQRGCCAHNYSARQRRRGHQGDCRAYNRDLRRPGDDRDLVRRYLRNRCGSLALSFIGLKSTARGCLRRASSRRRFVPRRLRWACLGRREARVVASQKDTEVPGQAREIWLC